MPRDRPPPLKIYRAADPQQRPLRGGLRQPPVIIHTYSPEIIHIESDRFRQLVQRLTGPGSHTPPPPKRARLVAEPVVVSPTLAAAPFRPAHSPLSPLIFDFSPSVLPSPPAFDLPLLPSPMGAKLPPSPGGGLLWRSPATAALPLPSPGPLTATFLADLPVLSPTTYSFIEKWASSPERLPTPRFRLPPRPPPTTTANFFPQTAAYGRGLSPSRR